MIIILELELIRVEWQYILDIDNDIEGDCGEESSGVDCATTSYSYILPFRFLFFY